MPDTPARPLTGDTPEAYWSLAPNDLAQRLHSGAGGLTSADAVIRLRRHGRNLVAPKRPLSRLRVFLDQLRNPLLLLLVVAAGIGAISGEWIDSTIVLTILLASVLIGYVREYRARAALDALRARVRTTTTLLRDGRPTTLPVEDVVPGDVVLLTAGNLVPADAVVLDAADCFVNQAVLTGESFPVAKRPGAVAADAAIGARANCVFLGTNVRSGTARGLVVATGAATQFGNIAERLTLRPPETDFEQGLRRFGYLLVTTMLVMVLVVFAVHVWRGRPLVETLLFAIALAVGLSPELLPAILAVNLARGAQTMARHGVLVRRLDAIENLGSMDVLCTDKTGTLTEGVVQVEAAYDPSGVASPAVLELAARHAALETGVGTPLDDAILRARRPDLAGWEKLGEIPFDFVRKRVAVVMRGPDGIARLVTKGAFRHVLEACTHGPDGTPLDASTRADYEARFAAWSRQGIRVLGVATRTVSRQDTYGRDDDRGLAFAGFVAFLDRPKEGAADAIVDLHRLGVAVKIITGDARLVAEHVATLVGLRADRVLTGRDLDELHDDALWHRAEEADLFVEVDPNQKERIIGALKRTGHVVGFLGDGVNDAPALHAADAGLSVETAVDVAREAADFVLLDRRLDVIRRGIEEGRRTFANTLKYVLTTMSANLGNMVSMAAASLVLPFLPLVASQVLLNNLLSDVPALGLADDAVDPELLDRPRRWDMGFIGRFMVEFGLLSSAFDALTFLVLAVGFAATPELFRTGWFVESLLTELVIALVVRTRRPFFASRPGTLLLRSTLAVIALAIAIPYLPGTAFFGFVPLPPALLATVVAITLGYVASVEIAKQRFYRSRE
jgi:Mg2+-importing ATPase